MDETLARLLRVEVLIFLIPIVAIVMGVGSKMMNRFFEHRERMAKIDAGIDPDREDEGSLTSGVKRGGAGEKLEL